LIDGDEKQATSRDAGELRQRAKSLATLMVLTDVCEWQWSRKPTAAERGDDSATWRLKNDSSASCSPTMISTHAASSTRHALSLLTYSFFCCASRDSSVASRHLA